MANGPDTPQERWENQSGWSPNTIATEIAGLICAADIARANGAAARAAAYEETADRWERRVESWTATDNSPYYGPRPYYLRITKDGDPNNGDTYEVGDNFPRPVDEREVVDQSFLGLVLFGVKPWDDPTVLNSLAVGDRLLEVETPNGPVWHRFTFDGYGETRDGDQWDIFDEPLRQTLGRAWPLLTGERGEYELLAGGDANPAPGDDRRHRQRRPDAARAGLGRPPADRDRRQRVRRGDPLGDAAGLDPRPVHPPRLVDRRGRADRAAGDRRLPVHGERAADAPRVGSAPCPKSRTPSSS